MIWVRDTALTFSAFLISLTAGVALGALAAARAGGWADTAITSAALLFYATPLYWFALMVVVLFSVQLEWLPDFGYETVGSNATGFARAWDIAQHLILPAMTLGTFFTAIYLRMTRAAMLEVASTHYS